MVGIFLPNLAISDREASYKGDVRSPSSAVTTKDKDHWEQKGCLMEGDGNEIKEEAEPIALHAAESKMMQCSFLTCPRQS